MRSSPKTSSTSTPASASSPRGDSGSTTTNYAVTDDAFYQNLAKGTPPVGFEEWSVAPKLGLLWHVSPQETFFARYHRGFRNPTNEDLNGSIVNLTTPPVYYRTKPNPALKAETSDSFDVGMRARRPGATYVVQRLLQRLRRLHRHLQPHARPAAPQLAHRSRSSISPKT